MRCMTPPFDRGGPTRPARDGPRAGTRIRTAARGANRRRWRCEALSSVACYVRRATSGGLRPEGYARRILDRGAWSQSVVWDMERLLSGLEPMMMSRGRLCYAEPCCAPRHSAHLWSMRVRHSLPPMVPAQDRSGVEESTGPLHPPSRHLLLGSGRRERRRRAAPCNTNAPRCRHG